MKQHLGAGLAVLALTAALSGCAGGGSTPAATSPSVTGGSPAASATAPAGPVSPTASPSSTTGAAVDLRTASSSAGNIVVDAKGMSVYFFTKDVKDSGTSACTEACLAAWPPVLTTAAQPAAEGISGELGTITTPDGAKQLTLNGLPLYYYAKDTKPGDILGQGVNNVWYLADPSGGMIKTGSSGY